MKYIKTIIILILFPINILQSSCINTEKKRTLLKIILYKFLITLILYFFLKSFYIKNQNEKIDLNELQNNNENEKLQNIDEKNESNIEIINNNIENNKNKKYLLTLCDKKTCNLIATTYINKDIKKIQKLIKEYIDTKYQYDINSIIQRSDINHLKPSSHSIKCKLSYCQICLQSYYECYIKKDFLSYMNSNYCDEKEIEQNPSKFFNIELFKKQQSQSKNKNYISLLRTINTYELTQQDLKKNNYIINPLDILITICKNNKIQNQKIINTFTKINLKKEYIMFIFDNKEFKKNNNNTYNKNQLTLEERKDIINYIKQKIDFSNMNSNSIENETYKAKYIKSNDKKKTILKILKNEFNQFHEK